MDANASEVEGGLSGPKRSMGLVGCRGLGFGVLGLGSVIGVLGV